MRIQAVDLAAVYSATCVLDGDGVSFEGDSWQRSEADFITYLTLPSTADWSTKPDVIVIEDLPHRLPFASLVKRVCRLQGRIIERFDQLNLLDRLMFVPPAEWRRGFDGLQTGTGPNAVVDVAARLNYEPPDTFERCRKAGDRTIARKVMTDYCAAFLIASWAQHTYHRTGSFDTKVTSRVTVAEA